MNCTSGRHPLRTFSILLSAAVAACSPAQPQRAIASPAASPATGAASLPVPLVAALLASRGMMLDVSAFEVGAVPKGYPAQLIPEGPVRILGGMRAGDRITVVFADSTRNLAAHTVEAFTRSGFARPPAEAGSGFMSAGGPYEFFCGDSATVSAQPLPGPDGILRVEYRKYRGRLGCPVRRSPPTERKRLRLPELVPPAGVRLGRTGGGGGSDEVNSRAEASGARLDPAALLSHFGGQLVAAGWRGGAPALGERVAAQHYRATDDAGDAWEGTLVAIGDTANVTLNLSMRRRPTP